VVAAAGVGQSQQQAGEENDEERPVLENVLLSAAKDPSPCLS
jgi:hypothetical protein